MDLEGLLGILCIGPLSEIYGRLPLYSMANILFCIFSEGAALSLNTGMLIVF